MTTHKRRSVTRFLTPVAIATILTACAPKTSTPVQVDVTNAPTQSAQSYVDQASKAVGSAQTDLLVLALKAALQEDNTSLAQNLVIQLSRQTLSQTQRVEWQLARAQLLISNQQYAQVNELLLFRPSWNLTDEQWRRYHTLKAQAYQQQLFYFDAAKSRIQLSPYLTDSEQVANNESIWNLLNRYQFEEITTFSVQPDESTLRQWLNLTTIYQANQDDLLDLKNAIERWMEANPLHTVARYTPSALAEVLQLEITRPENTALLLPLSGKFAKQAQLIRDGFLFAMMNDTQRGPDTTLTVLDTEALELANLESNLVEKGIDFIVGPLTKPRISEFDSVSKQFAERIPTLALNIPDQSQFEQDEFGINTCYLALSPEQEVEQAAQYLHALGYRYPLLLAPESSFGSRVQESFVNQWSQLSDTPVSTQNFGKPQQLQKQINEALGLQSSQQNIAQMELLLDVPLETEPRSRRDIDSVYIVANSSELILIKPFIEVAINPDTIPPALFSSSRSNTGQNELEDLSGVTYSDIPLLISPSQRIEQQMTELWPSSSNAEKRLQALGMDAYKLMTELPRMKVSPQYSVEGQTGQLTLGDKCVIERKISWGIRDKNG